MKPYRRKVIGEIDGIAVYGQYYDEDGKPSVAVTTWNGWQIERVQRVLKPVRSAAKRR